jgi:hypothetical protein
MRKTLMICGMAVLAIAIYFVSCKKDDNSNSDELVLSVQDDAEASSVADDIFNEVDKNISALDAGNFTNLTLKGEDLLLGTCHPSVSISPSNPIAYPLTITLDYGTAGCVGLNGNVKKGKLIVTLTSKMSAVNSAKTITFDNFYINDRKIEGTKTVTYTGLNGSQHPVWTVSVTGGKITRPDGKARTFEFTRTREQIAGINPPSTWSDKVFSITGSGKGTNLTGKEYTTTIDKPLIVAANCRWIKSGAITTSVGSRKITINYNVSTIASGTCDSLATVFFGGDSTTIGLRH